MSSHDLHKTSNENASINSSSLLSQIIDFTTFTLKQITAGVIAAVDNEDNEPSTSQWNEVSSQECMREERNVFPSAMHANNSYGEKSRTIGLNDTVNRSKIERGQYQSIIDIQEKLGHFDKKIDSCMGKIGAAFSELHEIRNNLKDVIQTISEKLSCDNDEKIMNLNFGKRQLSPNIISDETSKFTATQVSPNRHEFRSCEAGDNDVINDEGFSPKRQKTSQDESSSHHQDSENSSDCECLVKYENPDLVGFTVDNEDYVVVYTDGSCQYNGQNRAKAGIGIWFGDGHPFNVAEPVSGTPTNNNAEIQAARIAMELALNAGIKKLKICTDSEFLINCATNWLKNWKSKGWVTSANKPVKNRVELEKLDSIMTKLIVRWEKVDAHSGVKGNEMADMLANRGAAQYR